MHPTGSDAASIHDLAPAPVSPLAQRVRIQAYNEVAALLPCSGALIHATCVTRAFASQAALPLILGALRHMDPQSVREIPSALRAPSH